MLQVLAFLCTAGGSVGVYLASHRQRLVATVPAPGRVRAVGGLLMSAGFVLWGLALHPAAGFFTASTLTMGLWVALPYLGAWRLSARQGQSPPLSPHGPRRDPSDATQ